MSRKGSSGLNNSSIKDTIYKTLGIDPETPDLELRSMFEQRDELENDINNLSKELEKETIPSDDPEVKALGRLLASMFDEYTDRGEVL